MIVLDWSVIMIGRGGDIFKIISHLHFFHVYGCGWVNIKLNIEHPIKAQITYVLWIEMSILFVSGILVCRKSGSHL